MISEPSTLLTDYALAALTFALAWRLRSRLEGQRARAFWAVALLALALAALLGGTYHGFAPSLGELARLLLWKATVLSIGVAAAAMIAGSAAAAARERLRRSLTVFAAAAFVAYGAWMLFHNAYVFVVIDTAIAIVLVALLHGGSAEARRLPGSSWMLAAAAVSAIAAAIQASGFALHRHFNHNDLYHVTQMAAMGMFYAGVRRLRDRACCANPGRRRQAR